MVKYNLFNIVKDVIKSKNPRKYINKIKNKICIDNFRLIEKDSLIDILQKSRSSKSKILLDKLKKNLKTGFEVDENELTTANSKIAVNNFDIGKNMIKCKNKKDIFFLFSKNGNLFFKVNDIYDALNIKVNIFDITKIVHDTNIFKYGDILSDLSSTHIGNQENENSLFVNEMGFYSIIKICKNDEALQFKNWLCNDILPKIKKYVFSVINCKFNLDDYDKSNCFYIFKGKSSFYKYGITNDIKTRMSSHKSDGLLINDSMIKKIFVLGSYNQLMDIEKEIKNFVKYNGHRYIYKHYTELFKEASYNILIKKVQEEISKSTFKDESNYEISLAGINLEMLKMQKKHYQFQIENEKIKTENLNLKYKCLELENENIRMKNSNNCAKVENELNIEQLKLEIQKNNNEHCFKIKELESEIKNLKLEIKSLKTLTNNKNIIDNEIKTDVGAPKKQQKNLIQLLLNKKKEQDSKQFESNKKPKNNRIQLLLDKKKQTEIKEQPKKKPQDKYIKKKQNECLDCKAKIYNKSKRCTDCNSKLRFKNASKNRPSLETLLQSVDSIGYSATGRKYNVSDNCIRKWIKKYEKNNC